MRAASTAGPHGPMIAGVHATPVSQAINEKNHIKRAEERARGGASRPQPQPLPL